MCARARARTRAPEDGQEVAYRVLDLPPPCYLPPPPSSLSVPSHPSLTSLSSTPVAGAGRQPLTARTRAGAAELGSSGPVSYTD